MSDLVTSEVHKASRKAKLQLDQDWKISQDGAFVERSFNVDTSREASRLAGRVVGISMKQGSPIELRCNGATIVVSVMRSATAPAAQHLDRTQRGVAQKLDRFFSLQQKKITDDDSNG